MGQFFHKKSGSQENNQASILGCPHLFFGHQGRENWKSSLLALSTAMVKEGLLCKGNTSWSPCSTSCLNGVTLGELYKT